MPSKDFVVIFKKLWQWKNVTAITTAKFMQAREPLLFLQEKYPFFFFPRKNFPMRLDWRKEEPSETECHRFPNTFSAAKGCKSIHHANVWSTQPSECDVSIYLWLSFVSARAGHQTLCSQKRTQNYRQTLLGWIPLFPHMHIKPLPSCCRNCCSFCSTCKDQNYHIKDTFK